jgi:hypothetical protein
MFGLNLFHFYGPVGLLTTAFWIWMLYDCLRNEPDRYWLWIILLLHFPGALIYFLARKDWRAGLPKLAVIGRWFSGGELARAEAAVREIGNVQQYIDLAELLRERGEWRRAADNYRRALELDPQSKSALWGAARTAAKLGELAAGRGYLEQLLLLDPGYKFGEGSLEFGRVLVAAGEVDTAREHLIRHLDRWYHPEARVLLAGILIEQGERPEAVRQLELVLEDQRLAPDFSRRQNRKWAWKAKQMLRKL